SSCCEPFLRPFPCTVETCGSPRSPSCSDGPHRCDLPGAQADLSLGRPSSRERGVGGLPNRRVIVGIAEHVAPVDDDGEAASHAMPEAQPNSARGLEADDLDPKARAELPDGAFRELWRQLSGLAEQGRPTEPFRA